MIHINQVAICQYTCESYLSIDCTYAWMIYIHCTLDFESVHTVPASRLSWCSKVKLQCVYIHINNIYEYIQYTYKWYIYTALEIIISMNILNIRMNVIYTLHFGSREFGAYCIRLPPFAVQHVKLQFVNKFVNIHVNNFYEYIQYTYKWYIHIALAIEKGRCMLYRLWYIYIIYIYIYIYI